jgi:hypothetical protein
VFPRQSEPCGRRRLHQRYDELRSLSHAAFRRPPSPRSTIISSPRPPSARRRRVTIVSGFLTCRTRVCHPSFPGGASRHAARAVTVQDPVKGSDGHDSFALNQVSAGDQSHGGSKTGSSPGFADQGMDHRGGEQPDRQAHQRSFSVVWQCSQVSGISHSATVTISVMRSLPVMSARSSKEATALHAHRREWDGGHDGPRGGGLRQRSGVFGL